MSTKNITCAACLYNATDIDDFIKHCKSKHRMELSFWCFKCDKCFSNCGLLLAHIKEGDCVKEEMLYRCGFKQCKFATEKGQIFLHHVRHVHHGSSFLNCVECARMFTLPHCLIMHMQNNCTFKERHRKNYVDNSKGSNDEKDDTSEKKKEEEKDEDSPPLLKKTKATPNSASKATAADIVKGMPGIGRERGFDRRCREKSSEVHYSESSGSDRDDPTWIPMENDAREDYLMCD